MLLTSLAPRRVEDGLIFSASHDKLDTPRILSVLTAFVGPNEEQYLRGFIEDIEQQTLFSSTGNNCDVELLVGSTVQHLCTLSEQALELFTAFLRANRNVLLFAFWEDPGLYGMWNFLIQRHANGRYLTNANMDDRRRPDSWELKVRHLESNGQTGVVSTPVYFTTKVLSWVEAQAESKSLQVWFADKVGKEIDISDFFSIHYLYKTLWSNNFPHNSPMWRASIHKRVGYFNTTYDPLSDYEFWVRCRFYNIFFYVLPEPLELYYENPNSYDHRAGEGSFDQRVVMFTRFVYNLYLN